MLGFGCVSKTIVQLTRKTNSEATVSITHPRNNVRLHPPFTCSTRSGENRDPLWNKTQSSRGFATKESAYHDNRLERFYHRVKQIGRIPKTTEEVLNSLAPPECTFTARTEYPFLYIDDIAHIAIPRWLHVATNLVNAIGYRDQSLGRWYLYF